MTTMPQDQQFGTRFLGDITDWLDENLMPEDVFSREALVDWARENDYVHRSIIEKAQPTAWRELWQQWFDQDVSSPWYYDAGQDAEFCVACGSNREYGHDTDCVLAKAKAMLKLLYEEGRQ